MRRAPVPLPTTLLTLVLAGGLAACGGGGAAAPAAAPGSPTSAPAPAGPASGATAVVRAAAGRATAAGTSRFALGSRTVVTGKPLDISGTGDFDYARHEGELSLTLPASAVQERVVGGKVYLELSQRAGTWYVLPLDKVQGTSLGGSTDPSATFASLDAAVDGVTTVGPEKVRGTDATHYRGRLDVKKAVAAPGVAGQVAAATLSRANRLEVPFDAWVDAQGRLVRYVLALQIPAGPTTGNQPVTTTTTVELYDFGRTVTATPPPAAQVKDGAPLLAALSGRRP